MMSSFFDDNKIAVIGLGYVGLPLAVEFGKKFQVLGFDINKNRIDELKLGVDRTLESNSEEIKNSRNLKFSNNIDELRNFNIFIITVPTPIDKFNAPDLLPLKKASEMVGTVLKKGDIVIYESTVYPGCTEEDCVPILENSSGLKYNLDFYCGYSPERINPGDKLNTLTKIKKVTSGSTPIIAEKIDMLYKAIITAGTHKAPSIKVAEASKAIENAQRDLNISFVNELALIFDRMGIDTSDVIEAAGTKWNFLKFKPGLVGGHCIGVDPYYLAYKAESLGYHPQVILSGRRVNNNMGHFIANKVVKLMIQNSITVKSASVLILGFSFKENCPDFRNTRVIDICNELLNYGLKITVVDPWVNKLEVKAEYGIEIHENTDALFDVIIVAVAHDSFIQSDILKYKRSTNSIIYDTKSVVDRNIVNSRL